MWRASGSSNSITSTTRAARKGKRGVAVPEEFRQLPCFAQRQPFPNQRASGWHPMQCLAASQYDEIQPLDAGWANSLCAALRAATLDLHTHAAYAFHDADFGNADSDPGRAKFVE